jgi:hypothetical protein
VRVSGILLLIAMFAPALTFQQDAVMILRFGQVWDGERMLPNASIVVSGNRIAAVGSSVDVPKAHV